MLSQTSQLDLLLSIPSPSFNSIDIGPLTFTLYGLMIGLGIIAAALLARPRAVARGLHPDTPLESLIWLIPAGIVGARVYHLITDWVPIERWFKVWEGGLGIPGGVLAGALGGWLFVKKRGLNPRTVFDAFIPGVPLAQAIGRLGNWWNQELFGKPTELPWALEIDEAHRPQDFLEFDTFHPTFLYESLWNVALVAVLILVDRRRVLKPGKLVWVYAGGYAIGRLWIEALRIDNATEIFGVRVNLWTMGALLLFSLFMLRNALGGDGARSAAASSAAAAVDDDHDEDDAEMGAIDEEE